MDGITGPVQAEIQETPRVAKPRILAYPEPEADESKPEASSQRAQRSSKKPISRNGSVMKLAQNFVVNSQHQPESDTKSTAQPSATPSVPTTPEGGLKY